MSDLAGFVIGHWFEVAVLVILWRMLRALQVIRDQRVTAQMIREGTGAAPAHDARRRPHF